MKPLMEHEAKEILEKHGITTTKCIFCQSEEEAVRAARNIGFPVVMKVAGRKIIHKSDVGGVALNIENEREVIETFRKLIAIENAEGVNVQAMAEKGIEVILGVAENEQFGSILMFGLGGIFVEVLKDVSFRLLPLSVEDAEEMVKEVKGYKLLQGYRGVKGDVNALINLIMKVGKMVEEEGIVEMDLNPVFVYEKGYCVVDARMVVGERKSFDMEIGDISFFFDAQSIAVIGASRNIFKPGGKVVDNLKNLGFKGRVYPVNPNADEILGYKCYPSVKAIPDNVDIAVIAIPSKNAKQVVEECAEKGVKGIVVLSGGFAEGWEQGRDLEREIVKIARKSGIRIIGPNTMGILDPESGLTSFFSILRKIGSGNIGVLAQSGAFANFVLLSLWHVGFSRIIAIGNKCDINEVEVLKYLVDDDKTKVIAVYLEGFTNGRKFYEIMKESKKPIIVFKSGRTEAGKRSALSHTASISTSEEIFDAACKQAGVAKVYDFEELVDTVKAISLQPLPKGDRVGVIQPSGAECVMSADAVVENGLKLASYSDLTLEKIYELAPEWHSINNPLDLYPIAEQSGDEAFIDVLRVFAEDENIDAIVAGIFIPSLMKLGIDFSWLREYNKPVLFTMKDDIEELRKAKMMIEKNGFPVYTTPERAVRSLRNMWFISKKLKG
nr:acetate--CoA ligase [Archaeoglobus sp. JdFR-39]